MCCENILNDEIAQRPPQFHENPRKLEKNQKKSGEEKMREILATTAHPPSFDPPPFDPQPPSGPHFFQVGPCPIPTPHFSCISSQFFRLSFLILSRRCFFGPVCHFLFCPECCFLSRLCFFVTNAFVHFVPTAVCLFCPDGRLFCPNTAETAVVDHGSHNIDIPIKGHLQETGQVGQTQIEERSLI